MNFKITSGLEELMDIVTPENERDDVELGEFEEFEIW